MIKRLAAASFVVLCFSTAAHAQPSPGQSTLPPGIILVGTRNDFADPQGIATITVRNASGALMPGIPVSIDFTNCLDFELADPQPNSPGGQPLSVNCGGRRVTGTTNIAGQVVLAVVGSAARQYSNPPTTGPCAEVRAGATNTLLGTIRVAAYDLDGVNGLNATDHRMFLCDFGGGLNPTRVDYDFTGGVAAADLSRLLLADRADGSPTTGARCDGAPTANPLAGPDGSLWLRWDDCSGSGSALQTFACNTNTGGSTLVASMIAPDQATAVTELEAIVEFQGNAGVPLPSWWQFSTGACRGQSGLGTVSSFSPSCADPGVEGVGIIGIEYPTIDRIRARVFARLSGPTALTPGDEYYLFNLRVNRSKTVGAGSCAGCSENIEVKLKSVVLLQGPQCSDAPDTGLPFILVDAPYAPGTNVVHFQGVPEEAAVHEPHIYPAKGAAGYPRTVSISGGVYSADAVVTVDQGGTSFPVTNVVVDPSTSSLRATFDLTSAALGLYDVTVANPGGGSATKVDGFKVVEDATAEMWTAWAGLPNSMTGTKGSRQILFGDFGNADWQGWAFLSVYVPPTWGPVEVYYDNVLVTTTNPVVQGYHALVGTFSLPKTTGVYHWYKFVFGPVNSPGCGDLEFDYFQVPPTLPNELEASGAVILETVRMSGIQLGHTWPALSAAFLTAFKTAVNTQLLGLLGSFSTTPSANLAFSQHEELLRSAVEAALNSLAAAHAADVAAYRSVWNPLSTGASWVTVKASLPGNYTTLGDPPAPGANFPGPPVVAHHCFVGSRDPNDKHGPIGVTASRFISERAPLPYLVHFENMATATAPAQTVRVTDQLDPAKVDLSTFSFGMITFGDRVVVPPPGLIHYTTTVDLRPERDILVDIYADLNTTTGLITWRLQSLDPATNLPPEDPLEGFLPPNVTSPEGEGSVSFFVERQPDLPTGTSFDNFARIVFDLNEHIDTEVWSNVLDVDGPASAVQALSAQQNGTSFLVEWAGTDAGSGILDYSVYVSEDGGPYTSWLQDTPSTSAIFQGRNQHNYAFYSLSRDLVGHQEAAPAGFDASTAVTGVETPPQTVEFALHGVGGNPVAGNLVLDFSLRSNAPARIEMLDLTGRRVFTRDVSLGVGRHRLPVPEAGQLSPGIYWLRLTQGGLVAQRKTAFVR